VAVGELLPERAAVPWRAPVSSQSLKRSGWLWTVSTAVHSVPFLATALALAAIKPLTAPVDLILIAHAWIIPELYAARGANVVRVRRPAQGDRDAEDRAAGLLGDLVGHAARDLHAGTGLVPERGALGTWVIGEGGALLIRPGGRRVLCFCVRAVDPSLPRADRIAHLLLALRSDEIGFATVANLAFSGARWRLRRRLDPLSRRALDQASQLARAERPRGRPGRAQVCT
jgi:hypothetical protein